MDDLKLSVSGDRAVWSHRLTMLRWSIVAAFSLCLVSQLGASVQDPELPRLKPPGKQLPGDAVPGKADVGNDLVAIQVLSAPEPPEFPEASRADFRVEAQRQIQMAENILHLLKNGQEREGMDVKMRLSAIEVYAMIKLSADKTLADLGCLRAHLNQIENENWGASTGEVRKYAHEALGHLNQYDAYSRSIGDWRRHLDRLRASSNARK